MPLHETLAKLLEENSTQDVLSAMQTVLMLAAGKMNKDGSPKCDVQAMLKIADRMFDAVWIAKEFDL